MASSGSSDERGSPAPDGRGSPAHDGDDERQTAARRRAAVAFDDLSDDESDGSVGRDRKRSRGSPRDDDASSDGGSSRRSGSPAPARARSESPAVSGSPPPPPPPSQRHQRALLDVSRAGAPLDIVQTPPGFDVPLEPCNPSKDPLPDGIVTSVLYRLKMGVRRADVEHAVGEYGALVAMARVADSNAQLVTWSDGSKTLRVGEEQFTMTQDRNPPPEMYVFRKGEELHAQHGAVGGYVRVQPAAVDRKRNKSLMETIGGGSKTGRVMLRNVDGDDEAGEKERLKKHAARERENARLQSKRNRKREIQARPNAQLTRRALDSDSDDDEGDDGDGRRREEDALARERRRREEDRAARIRQAERESRLREAKRRDAEEDRQDAVRRRKLGARRVIASDDDDDDDDDE